MRGTLVEVLQFVAPKTMCWSIFCTNWPILIAMLLAAIARADNELVDLRGVTLRCCVVLERPYVIEDRGNFFPTYESRFSGLAITYLRDLEEALNFNCKLYRYDGKEGNLQGFTGLTQYFAGCAEGGDSSRCMCDIAASGFVKTSDRLARVDFAESFAIDSFSVAQRSVEIEFPRSQLFFMRPFSVPVWCGVALLIFTHTFTTVFDRHFQPPEKESALPAEASLVVKVRHILLKAELLRRIRYAFIQTSKHMVGAETEPSIQSQHRSTPVRQQFLQLGAILMGVFLILTYEAALVSQLQTDSPVSEFRSMEDVKNCRIDAPDFCLPKGGATEDYWKFAIERSREDCRIKPAAEDQPRIIEAHDKFHDPSSAGLNAVATGKCKYLLALTSTVTVAAEGKYCNALSVVGDPFIHTAVSFVLPKNSGLTQHISAATVSFKQQDKLRTPLEYGVKQKCSRAWENKLNWRSLGFFFYFAWICHIIMLVYMLVDRGKPPGENGNDVENLEESDSITRMDIV